MLGHDDAEGGVLLVEDEPYGDAGVGAATSPAQAGRVVLSRCGQVADVLARLDVPEAAVQQGHLPLGGRGAEETNVLDAFAVRALPTPVGTPLIVGGRADGSAASAHERIRIAGRGLG